LYKYLDTPSNKNHKFGKKIMKASLQLDITFDQILSLVKQLPKKEKIILTKELEKEVIDAKFSKLLKSFQSDDISEKEIDAEVEAVRQERYDREKH